MFKVKRPVIQNCFCCVYSIVKLEQIMNISGTPLVKKNTYNFAAPLVKKHISICCSFRKKNTYTFATTY